MSKKYPHHVDLMSLPCGSIAHLDKESGFSYRCMNCHAVVGSVGMPQRCRDEVAKWDNWERMGGKNWDYRVPADHMIMIDDWADD